MKKILVVTLLIPLLFGCADAEKKTQADDKVTAIAPGLVTSSYTDNPSDWKVYNNEEYGYSFIYHTTNILSPDSDSLVSLERWSNSRSYTVFEVEAYDVGDESADLKSFARQIWESIKKSENTTNIGDISEVTVDSKEAYRFTATVEVTENDSLVRHTYQYIVAENGIHNYVIKTFDEVYMNTTLKSFSFENGTLEAKVKALKDQSFDTSDWQFYENKKYRYSLMLPSNGHVGSNDYATSADMAMSVGISVLNVRTDNKGLYRNEWHNIKIDIQDPELFHEEYADYMSLGLKEFATYLWEFNDSDEEDRKKGKQVGVLEETTLDGKPAYQFILNKSFVTPKGGGVLDGDTLYIITSDGTCNYIISSAFDNPYLKEILDSFRFQT